MSMEKFQEETRIFCVHSEEIDLGGTVLTRKVNIYLTL